MIKLFRKKRKGFTLIELIVVIAILGILAALAVPRLFAAREDAEEKANAANIRTIESAISVYNATTGNEVPEDFNLETLVPNYLKEIPTPPDGYGKYEWDGTKVINGTVTQR